MATSKKDYEAVARMIREARGPLPEGLSPNYSRLTLLVDALADYFETDNPRFDRNRFIAATF